MNLKERERERGNSLQLECEHSETLHQPRQHHALAGH